MVKCGTFEISARCFPHFYIRCIYTFIIHFNRHTQSTLFIVTHQPFSQWDAMFFSLLLVTITSSGDVWSNSCNVIGFKSHSNTLCIVRAVSHASCSLSLSIVGSTCVLAKKVMDKLTRAKRMRGYGHQTANGLLCCASANQGCFFRRFVHYSHSSDISQHSRAHKREIESLMRHTTVLLEGYLSQVAKVDATVLAHAETVFTGHKKKERKKEKKLSTAHWRLI